MPAPLHRLHHRISIALAFACAAALAGQPVALAQVTPAAPSSAGAPAPYSETELANLVGPIALYPDDLVAIILPASTYPLQIVQANRFLDKRKANAQLQPEAGWDDSVKSLLNYPEVVKKMSDDLDWTEALGEAVVANSSAVLDAVQAFRRRAQAAGSLTSNDKQKVVVEKEVIQIVPANPQVIYVPQYQPATVVVAGAPPVAYYPTPYPVYYYPYPPGAALATGIIWGAALGAAWNGGRWGTNYCCGGGGSANINNSNNITINRGGNTINTGGNRPGGGGGGSAWKPTQKPGQVGRPSTRPAGSSRVGDARPGGGGGYNAPGGGARPNAAAAGARPGGMAQQNFGHGGAQQGAMRQQGGGGGAFGGIGAGGGAAQQASARGQSSRAGAGNFGGGGRPAGGGAAPAARGGGGAAPARAGGGGRARR